MGWLTNFFAPLTLNPAIAAAGAGLIAAPILIHLINRMRYRKVRFAAMEFLLASQQKNRRRVLIEQLLLLLLRVLIVIGMILLIARLILDPSTLALLRAGAMTHHVVVIDDSGSMQNRIGDSTAFDDAKSIVRKLVAEAARESDSQLLTLILLSQARENVAFFTERRIDDTFLNELDTKLQNVAATHQALSLRNGLEAARQRLASERAGARLLHVISDFRRTEWLDQPELVTEVAELGETGVAVNLVRVVDEETPNLAVTSVGGDLDAAAAGVPVRVRVGVTNWGSTVAENVTVGVVQDGQPLPISERFTQIEPGDEVFAEFDLSIAASGLHALQFELSDDALPADDRRHVAVEVAAGHPVLIVDGTPGRGDGAGLLADALAPAPGLSGVQPRIEPVDFLRRSPLGEFRAIYLVNVPSLPPDAVRALENYVRAGGGLAWFLGNAVQPQAYNEALVRIPERDSESEADAGAATDTGTATDDDGNAEDLSGESADHSPGLFPAPLAAARIERRLNPDSDAIDVSFQPVGRFAPFAGELGKYWRGTHVASLLPLHDDWERSDDRRADGVTTVASLKSGDPLILAHRFGEGRVLTVLTSAGQSWTNWPRQFIYVPFVLESFKFLAARSDRAGSLEAGQVLSFRLPAADYDPEIHIERPDGTSLPIRATPGRTESGGQEPSASGRDAPDESTLMLLADYTDTDEPGVYKVATAPTGGGTLEQTWYAVNAPPAESRLQLAEAVTLRQQFEGALNVTVRDPGELSWLRVQEAGREARLLLLGLLAALLIGEQALAYRLSYHPRTPAGVR